MDKCSTFEKWYNETFKILDSSVEKKLGIPSEILIETIEYKVLDESYAYPQEKKWFAKTYWLFFHNDKLIRWRPAGDYQTIGKVNKNQNRNH